MQQNLVEIKSLKCPRCNYSWQFKGYSIYAQCPRCYRRFKARDIAEVMVEA